MALLDQPASNLSNPGDASGQRLRRGGPEAVQSTEDVRGHRPEWKHDAQEDPDGPTATV